MQEAAHEVFFGARRILRRPILEPRFFLGNLWVVRFLAFFQPIAVLAAARYCGAATTSPINQNGNTVASVKVTLVHL